MHNRTNNVKVEGLISEIGDTVVTGALTDSATSIAVEATGGNFHKIISGVAISDSNPGYLKIGTEIIKYSAISNDGNVLMP